MQPSTGAPGGIAPLAVRACYAIAYKAAIRLLANEAHGEEVISDHYARLAGLHYGMGDELEAAQAAEKSERHRVRACMATYDLSRWLSYR